MRGQCRVRCAAAHDAGANNNHVKVKTFSTRGRYSCRTLGCYDDFRFDSMYHGIEGSDPLAVP
jgi:hypothetical protein